MSLSGAGLIVYEKAEDLWRQTMDDIAQNEQGRVKKEILYDEKSGRYSVREEYASQQIMFEYRNKPFHLEIGESVKKEDLLERWPEETEVMVCRRIMGNLG